MNCRRFIGLASLATAILLADAGMAVAQQVLSAQKPGVLATPEGRLLIGRGKDYVPSTTDSQVLFDELESSMKKRRDFGWKVVEQLLQPVKIKLLDGVTEVDVPLWQTWFEGRSSGAAGNRELEKITELYFRKLKPVLTANPNADVKVVIADTMKEFSTRDLSASLTDENLSAVLHQLSNTAEAGRLLGQGTTMFSPSFIEHALKEARGIDRCRENVSPNQEPPSSTQFSPCMEEFPRSAVMIKTSWRPIANKIPRHDTTPAAMAQVIREGTWRGPGRPDLAPPPLETPDRSRIYTNITSQGTEWALIGIHFVTKDVREWAWVSLWWDPDASKDFGADRPDSIDRYNGGVWKNYKMCINTAFAERDPRPWSLYTGAQSTLGDSLKAVYDAIQAQIDGGATSRPQDFPLFFGSPGLPNPLELPGALGPWPAPHNAQTSWCSNPNVETHPGNGRTSCIGCHQIAFTRNERRNTSASFVDALVGDVQQFSRSRARKNFPAEFSWSFGFEFRPSIAIGKMLAGFEWPN